MNFLNIQIGQRVLLISYFFNKYFLTKFSVYKAHIRKHLSQEARGCGHLVLWLDCDREGENICFEGKILYFVLLIYM